MKKYIFLLLAICSIANINAQNTLKGIITNLSDEKPLSASIYIPLLEKGTIADFDGNYEISNIPNGRYIIVYSLIGHETFSKSILFSENSVVSENITLEQVAIEMEEVIISTPFHKLQRDNVMKVERISAKKLSQFSSTNLSEGIKEIPGVNSISTGTSIGKPVIRGLSSNRVLVYTQGIRLENQQFGGEHGLGLNDSGIESVEVIKGPASLLYGSDAIGGVLYVNPEKFANPNDSKVSAGFNYLTNTEGINTNIGYKTSTDNFKFLIRGSITEHADYKTDSIRVTNTRFKEQDIKAAIGYQGTIFSTDFRYNLTASQYGIPEEIGVQELSKDPLLPSQEIDNHIFSSKSKL
ncbi:MAG: TonB-dependent receptor plug domain-containing protein, partial [Flavobacteriaceae bacterium]|nr:TonB-dependent receptor plug domain-containing protein [Flavobacteriaceae bacterium]